MSNRLANDGVQLVTAGKYAQGIEKLTQALKDRPAPLWLLERSKAYLRTKELDLALHDAETALSVAFKRANRDHMIEAQLRRAITLFRMERYADADVCAYWAISLVDGAKATADDGQQNLVDANGDYKVTLGQVEAANQAEYELKKKEGMNAAMGNTDNRSKGTSLRNQASTWRLQALTAMEKLPARAPGRKVEVVKYPTPSAEPPTTKPAQSTDKVVEIESDGEQEATKPEIPEAILNHALGKNHEDEAWRVIFKNFQDCRNKNNLRTDFYQTDTALTASIFVKNVSKDDLKVDSTEQSITLSPIPSVPSGSVTLNLFDKIKPSETQYTVKSMKIELVMQKATPGKWGALKAGDETLSRLNTVGRFYHHLEERECPNASDLSAAGFGGYNQVWYNHVVAKLQAPKASKESKPEPQKPAKPVEPERSSHLPSIKATTRPDLPSLSNDALPPRMPVPAAKNAPPAYPTSSKSGPKNWDSVAAEEDDSDEEKESGDVNDFFKKIYAGADPDAKRAMMKSFTESNGTSLSTDWASASKTKYKTEPPEGAEVKEWDK
ncbi:SGS domain-containing protein [Pseudomassariella vexata]|uniref:SGS domain-domain-containing protein n=1 Tax=Pseudomassariella vexata TaxID=1141098 RepID=A0A1Y2EMU5_9PEZI|nr:SGS domain-containing protein [Pseudomassariella vexata]ORY72155.1 SGS domain-domain-containing protein [Pseudomassariella vexata]